MKVKDPNEEYFSSKTRLLIYDDLLKFVGNRGKYQWRVFITFALSMFTQSIIVTGQAFLFITPPLLCDGTPCDQIQNYCDKKFNIQPDSTAFPRQNIITDFQLYCNKEILATIAESLYFFGSVIGTTIFSFISVKYIILKFIFLQDKYGRKIAMTGSQILVTAGTIGITTSVNIYMYMIFNLMMGFGAMPMYILGFVILNEVCEKQFRQNSSIALLGVWSSTTILVSILFLSIKQWRIILLAFAVAPAIGCLILVLTLKETPQFHLTQKKFEQFYQSLDHIASSNSKDVISPYIRTFKEKIDPQYLDLDPEQYQEKAKEELRVFTIADLFRFKSLRTNSIGFIFISFTLHLIYFGGEYSISDISNGDETYYLGAFMGVAESLGYFLVSILISKLQRKKSIIGSYIMSLAAISCFFFFGFSAEATKTDCDFCLKKILVLVIASLIRIFNCFGFGIQGLYANEVYPTVVRSLGTGFLFAVGIIGSFMAPYIIQLGDTIKLNPYFLIGGICLTGPFTSIAMKETLNKPLPEEIEELKVRSASLDNTSSSMKKNNNSLQDE